MNDQTRALIGAPAALASVLFVWIPVCLYAHNILEMGFTVLSVLPFLLALAGIAYLGLLLIVRSVRGPVRRRSLLVGLNLAALLFWVPYKVIGGVIGITHDRTPLTV